MMRTRKSSWMPALLALVVAVPAAAQESPLAHIPAKAPIVIQLKGVERTKGRLLAMLRNALPDLAGMAETELDKGFQEALEGRNLKGFAPEGPIFLAFTDVPKQGEEIPNVAAIIKVTSYAAFRDGILKEEERKSLKKDGGFEVATVEGQDTYFIDRKTYAIVTPKKEVAQQFAKKQPGLDTTLSKEVAKQLLEPDLAVYVDVAAVYQEYGDQIKSGRQFLELMMQQQGQFGKEQKEGVDMLFQALDDLKVLLLSADFRPEGLAFHFQVHFKADSKVGGKLKDSKVAALKELGTLPPGHVFYVESAPEAKSFRPVGQEQKPGTAKIENQETLDRLITEAAPRVQLAMVSLSPNLSVWQCAKPAKATEAQRKYFETLKDEKREFKASDKKHRGFDLHHAVVIIDYDAIVQQQAGNPGAKVMADWMKKRMGEKTDVWFGHNDKVYVEVSAKDWDAAKTALDGYLDNKSPIGRDKAFAEARKQLPEQASAVILMHAPSLGQWAVEIIPAVMKEFGMDLATPAALPKGEPAYFGMAFGAQGSGVTFDMWVSGAGVREVRKMVELLFRNLN